MTDGTRASTATVALHRIAWALVAGLVAILVLALSANDFPGSLATGGVGILVAGAAAMAGGLLGFLFGIPRSLQAPDTSAQSSKTTRGEGAAQGAAYGSNTNLEQISDWLTKILVGVGLTQLNELPGGLHAMALFVSPALGDVPRPDVFAMAALLYFAIAGFLFGYLWTRFFMPEALGRADLAALAAIVKSERQQQSEIDAKALTLVRQHLNPTDPAITPADLKDVITRASAEIRAQVRNLAIAALDARAAPKAERTIPIFRALLESDGYNYDDHYQLAWALKDQEPADWAEAEKEINKAIQRRGAFDLATWGWYEFYRAVCRINQEPATGVSPRAESILVDLRLAARDPLFIDQVKKEGEYLVNWIKRNDSNNELGVSNA